jgi:hypothetical protein
MTWTATLSATQPLPPASYSGTVRLTATTL